MNSVRSEPGKTGPVVFGLVLTGKGRELLERQPFGLNGRAANVLAPSAERVWGCHRSVLQHVDPSRFLGGRMLAASIGSTGPRPAPAVWVGASICRSGTAFIADNRIHVVPPAVVTAEEVRQALAIYEEALTAVRESRCGGLLLPQGLTG